ncbi:MAG: response regulator, partial [Terriglobales bacterium]
MSIKVLLADDNITAQRMGSKILTDAGYEVIAVSNGAAAVKKIAAEKPQLLILDVFMPGYTGLEVCDKVKQDPATAGVTVILTATNMEPYNQADGNRVRADGFMVKPFEATDLVAVVQKFEKKMKPAEEAHTIKMAAVEEFKDASYEEWKSDAGEEAAPAKVEVPHEMASAPAFMDDYAEAAPAAEAPAFAIEQQPAVEETPAFAMESTPAPSFGEPAAEAPVDAAPMSFEMHETAPAPLEMPNLEIGQTTAEMPAFEMPGMQAHFEPAPPAEFEPTSAPLAPSIEVTTAAELETTSIESPDISVGVDPALVTDADEMSHFATGFGVENAEEIPVGVAMTEEAPAEEPAPVAVEESTPEISTQKIETYEEPAHATAFEESPAAEMEAEMQRAFAVSSSGAAAAPALAVEPEPAPEHPAAASAPIPEELVAQFAAELDQVHQEREAMGEAAPVEEAQSIEASMEAAKEIPASQLDEERIAVAVNRALDKYKEGLRAELIATIVR